MTEITEIPVHSFTQVGNKEDFLHIMGEKKFVLLETGVLIVAPSTTKHSEMLSLTDFAHNTTIVAAGNFKTHYDVGDNDWQPHPRVTRWGSISLELRGHKISDDQKHFIEEAIIWYFRKWFDGTLF